MRALLRGKVDTVMRRAALVLVGNEYLAERARRAGAKRVECLPTVVDVERYGQVPDLAKGLRTIGWIGSPITAPYLALVQAALAEICQHGNVRVVIVGAQHVPLAEVPVETRAWSEQTEVKEIRVSTWASCRCPMSHGSVANAVINSSSIWPVVSPQWRLPSA